MKSREKLQKLSRRGIVLDTPDGLVDVTGTADVWGEGPNVDGFRFPSEHEFEAAERSGQVLDQAATEKWFGKGFFEMAAAWAASRK
jgi:hypothetical protein